MEKKGGERELTNDTRPLSAYRSDRTAERGRKSLATSICLLLRKGMANVKACNL